MHLPGLLFIPEIVNRLCQWHIPHLAFLCSSFLRGSEKKWSSVAVSCSQIFLKTLVSRSISVCRALWLYVHCQALYLLVTSLLFPRLQIRGWQKQLVKGVRLLPKSSLSGVWCLVVGAGGVVSSLKYLYPHGEPQLGWAGDGITEWSPFHQSRWVLPADGLSDF